MGDGGVARLAAIGGAGGCGGGGGAGTAQVGRLAYEDALIGWLAERDLLLVLDNCEHLFYRPVNSLTAPLPRLRILATSREPLWSMAR
jgi:hypothetical protein